MKGARQLPPRNRLIVGLDVGSAEEALRMVSRLRGEIGLFKVGMRLFLHAGPEIVRRVHQAGGEVFLDLKLHDIPETVAAAAVEAARLGVFMLDVHASGGQEMMRHTCNEVRRVCQRERLRRPLLLAVTVLTSLDGADLKRVGVAGSARQQVLRLAQLAREAGMDGVVTSPRETRAVRDACGPRFVIVTPGIRLTGATRHDQKRIATPRAAITAGADYIVVARAIRDAADPVAAARRIVASIAPAPSRPRLRR